MAKASGSRTSARPACSLLQPPKPLNIKQSGEGEIPLALPLISEPKVGQFYFGDPPPRWVSFHPALTKSDLVGLPSPI